MRAGSRKIRSLKRRLRSRAISRQRYGGKRTRRYHKQRGGYAQYQNNLPMTPSYQVAGINLPASQLALANPAPITRLGGSANCIDNYNHFTNKGFPSRGH